MPTVAAATALERGPGGAVSGQLELYSASSLRLREPVGIDAIEDVRSASVRSTVRSGGWSLAWSARESGGAEYALEHLAAYAEYLRLTTCVLGWATELVIDTYRKLLAREPNNVASMVGMAWWETRNGSADEAVAWLDRAVASGTPDAELLGIHAAAQLQRGQPDAALYYSIAGELISRGR